MAERDFAGLRVAVCAPVSLASNEMRNRTAAFRKLRLILTALVDLGCEVTLLESLHVGSAGSLRSTYEDTAALDGQRVVRVIRPFALPFPRLTKTVQAMAVPWLASRLMRDFAPDLLWIYNGYLFEARLATALSRHGLPFVLELEDLPALRRSFPFNIKTRFDIWGFARIVRKAAAVLCVNSDLCDRIRPTASRTILFPPFVDPAIERRAMARRAPLSGAVIRVGYCGGLDEEKGADVFLRIVDRLPRGVKLHIAGIGPLAPALAQALARQPDRGRFHGYVPDEELPGFLCSMDVLVNPHRDIAAMGGGIFPFKVFEYLAAGSVVVTTDLPAIEGVPLDRLITFDGTTDGLSAVLDRIVSKRDVSVDQTVRQAVLNDFGLPGATARIAAILDAVLPQPAEA